MEFEIEFDIEDGRFLISVIRSEMKYGEIIKGESKEDGLMELKIEG